MIFFYFAELFRISSIWYDYVDNPKCWSGVFTMRDGREIIHQQQAVSIIHWNLYSIRLRSCYSIKLNENVLSESPCISTKSKIKVIDVHSHPESSERTFALR